MSVERVPIGLLTGPWLPLSETFVFDQLLMARRTRPFVCARGLLASAQHFPTPDLTSLSAVADLTYRLTRYAPAFERSLTENRARLIHAHFGTNGALGLRLAERLNLPLVVTFHGHDVAGLEPRNRYTVRYFDYQRAKKALFQRASLLLCASTDLATRLVEEHGAPPEKVKVHFLGIDLTRFSPVERSPTGARVISVGRLVEKKGLSDALLAFSKVAKAVPEATFRIIGDGPLRKQLEAQTIELGLTEKVTFLGAVPASVVATEMAEASLLCCPSVVAKNGDLESGVIVLKEAGARGLPTIGTLHGGIPEVIEDGVTGYLVPERAPEELSERMRRLLTDPALRSRMGQAAIQKIANEYDTVRQNARLEELLLSIL